MKEIRLQELGQIRRNMSFQLMETINSSFWGILALSIVWGSASLLIGLIR